MFKHLVTEHAEILRISLIVSEKLSVHIIILGGTPSGIFMLTAREFQLPFLAVYLMGFNVYQLLFRILFIVLQTDS